MAFVRMGFIVALQAAMRLQGLQQAVMLSCHQDTVTPAVNACRSCRGCTDACRREALRCLLLRTAWAVLERPSVLQLRRLPGSISIVGGASWRKRTA